MAAAYPLPGPQSQLKLVDSFTGCNMGNMTACMFIPSVPKPYKYSVISVSDDKRLAVWVKSKGKLDKVIYMVLEAEGTALAYDDKKQYLYIGLDSGTIKLYHYPCRGRDLKPDFGIIQFVRDFAAHKMPVVGMGFSERMNLLLSCAKDNLFMYHSIERGAKLGQIELQPNCTGFQFDDISNKIFISDTCGSITILTLNGEKVEAETPFVLHMGSINKLIWSGTTKLLYSTSEGSLNIAAWDPETRETKYELNGHNNGTKISALAISNGFTKLFSAGEHPSLVMWEIRVPRMARLPVVKQQWCSGCKKLFLWNVPRKAAQLIVGDTYNHCQYCGLSICKLCPMRKLTLPAMGFEVEAKLCQSCYYVQMQLSKIPLALFLNTGEGEIKFLSVDDEQQIILTADYTEIKIWDLSPIIKHNFFASR